MTQRVIVLGLLVLLWPCSFVAAQGDAPGASKKKKQPAQQTSLVGRYSNNAGPGSSVNQFVRLINAQNGPPGNSPVGDVCVNLYVFDNNQVLISCCACRVTPSGLATASVGDQLTGGALTSVIPAAGTISIVPLAAKPNDVCSPVTPFDSSDASLVRGYGTHVEVSGGATYISETELPPSLLGSEEAAFLSNACLFVQYLGSGRGRCDCTEPGG